MDLAAPFIGAIVWAATIVVATWPLMISVQAWLWGRHSLARAAMTLFCSYVSWWSR